MKQSMALLLLLISFNVRSQTTQPADPARDLISDLIASWTLGVDSNTSTVDIGMFNKYKDLFAENARVDDDLRIRFLPAKGAGTYKVLPVSKDFDEYAHDVALEVNNLRVDNVTEPVRLNRNDSIVYELKRTVYIEKPAKYVLADVDALVDTMIALHPDILFEKKNEKARTALKQEMKQRLRAKLEEHPDSVYKFFNTSVLRVVLNTTQDPANPYRIVGIQNFSNELRCVNDADLDGVPDFADINPQRPGEFTANGAPDADLDAISDSADYCKHAYGTAGNHGCPESYFIKSGQLDFAIGIQANNATIQLPELDQLGYQDASGADAMDVLQSNPGSLKNSAPSAGTYLTGNLAYFFGKNARKAGVSIGINYGRFVTTYELDEPIIYTYKSSDGVDEYRRQITVSSLNERMTYNLFNFPIQFNYRMKMGAKKNWVMQFKAGPSLMYFQGLTDYNTTIDVGGIYQIDSVSGGRIVYNEYFDKNSTWNVYLTSSGINKQNTRASAAAIFDGLQRSGGYDFAANKVYRDQKNISRLTYALNFAMEAQYKKSRDNPWSLKAGVHIIYAPSTASNEKYKIIDKTTDEYNSVFNSNGKSYYFAYGFSIGLVYDL